LRIPFRIPARHTRQVDVCGFGLNSIDLVTVVAEYPPGNTKQRMQRFAELPGGQTATAMAVCARLGLRARYVGSFGDDERGVRSRASLLEAGVDLAGSRTVAGATNQFAVVIVDARSGARTVLWNRHAALAMDPSDVPRAAVTSGRMLVVDCHETLAAARAARSAREEGIPTVVDVEKVRPGVHDLLRYTDAIIASEAFPSELTAHEDPGRALRALADEFDAPLVCMTLGEGGSLARCGGREIRTAGFSVACVDTTGAGDAFRGGFAAACLRAPEADVEEVLAYANAVAALNCRALGARGAMPTPEEVDRLLASRLM
jgi:sugar/nucleoside kinase (ribokinase family)